VLANGYVNVLVGKECTGTSQIYMLEHRYIMEQHLGRKLAKYETVHHKNGDRSDNRVENLEVKASRHGPGVEPIEQILKLVEHLTPDQKKVLYERLLQT
jgi:hypothetical protein